MKQITYIILIFSVLTGCKNKTKTEVETCKVQKGVFNIDVTEEGEIKATRSINISSPAMSWQYGMLKINKIIDDGAEVKEGEVVIEFDPSEVQKVLIDAKSELDIAKAELEKLVATQESKINELEANLKISELAYKISEINFEQSVYEADITKKEIRLNLDKAKISLGKARDEIENQKVIHKEEVQQAKLKIGQLTAKLDDAKQTLKNLNVVSPSPGIAIIRENRSTKSKWQVGDQTWSGNPLIDLPDLSEIKAEAEINEVDISKIKLGQKVEIKLDAFSDTIFTGEVIKIANLAKYKDKSNKIKVFPIEILLEGTSKKLLPGITVSCKIIINKIEDQLFIPIEALFNNGTEEYVYLKSGGSYKKKIIETGVSNNDYIIIEKGLKEKDILALSNPFEEKEKENNKDKKD